MTRGEAIQILSTRDQHGVPCGYTSGYQEALDMAIEALQNLSKPNNGLQGSDIIRRSDALKPFCIAPDGTRIPEVDCDNFPVEFSVEFIKKHLLSLPSEEPKTGRWILTPMLPDIHRYKCSNCMSHHRARYEFCPSCGAKMVSCEKCKHWESDTGYCYEIADSDTHECHFERRGEEE